MVTVMAQVSENQWDARQYPVDYRQFLQLERSIRDWFLVLLDTLAAHGIQPKSRNNSDERVIHAVHLMDAQSLGELLNQETLARQVGLSAMHLTRLFHHVLGCTPKQYFEKRRTDYAYRRLRMSDARMKAVAITLRFLHSSHFSKWFKQQSSKSPREFTQTR